MHNFLRSSDDVEIFSLIWLDDEEKEIEIELKLRGIINDLKKFSAIADWNEFFDGASEKTRFIILSRNIFFDEIIEKCLELPQIKAVYLYGEEDRNFERWKSKTKKVRREIS